MSVQPLVWLMTRTGQRLDWVVALLRSDPGSRMARCMSCRSKGYRMLGGIPHVCMTCRGVGYVRSLLCS